MKIIFGLFDTYQQADSTLLALEMAGVTREDISLIAQEEALHTEDTSDTTKDAGRGAGIGGLVGLIAGAASIAIPGIGPVIGAGTITGGLIGGAGVGSLVGGIVGLIRDTFGIGDDYSTKFEEGIKQGKILLVVKAKDELRDDIASAMKDHGVKELHTHDGPA